MSFLSRFFSRGGSHHIGIDFGSAEIKAVQIGQSSRGPVLEHVYRMPTPINAIKDGIVVDPPAVGDALRQLSTGSAVVPIACAHSLRAGSSHQSPVQPSSCVK